MFEGHLSHQKLHRPGKTWEGWNSVIRMDHRQDLSTGQARRSTLQQSSSANLAPWPAVYGCITSFRAKNFSKQRRDNKGYCRTCCMSCTYMHFTSSNKALVVYLASNLRRATAWNFHEPIFVMDEFAWAKKNWLDFTESSCRFHKQWVFCLAWKAAEPLVHSVEPHLT